MCANFNIAGKKSRNRFEIDIDFLLFYLSFVCFLFHDVDLNIVQFTSIAGDSAVFFFVFLCWTFEFILFLSKTWESIIQSFLALHWDI